MALVSYLTNRLPRAWPLVLGACRYRTDVTDPAKHSKKEDGSFYLIDDADYDGYLNTFFRRQQTRMMDTLGERALMVRAPAREVISVLGATDFSSPVVRYVFYGRRGAGVTNQLAHVAHWCGRQRWLLVHAHSLQEILHYSPGMEPSSHNPDLWDSPAEAVAWLKRFSAVNSVWLEERRPRITREVVWNLKESSAPGVSWQEVIQFGIARPKYATDALAVILREIREQATASVGAQDGGVRALVCIDGVNALWCTHSRLRFNQRGVSPSHISMFAAFRRLLQSDWCNGAVVTSVSQKAAWKNARDSYMPRYLLGQEGFEFLEPFVPVLVDAFNQVEAQNFVKYHVDLGWVINRSCKGGEGVKQMIALSDSNPHELSLLCAEW